MSTAISNYPENSSFSKKIPGLQLAWDGTSYAALKKCAFYYYLTIRMGYQPRHQSVHLTFGIAFHYAAETYHRLIAQSLSHEEALHAVVAAAYYRQLKTPEEQSFYSGYHEHALPSTEPTKTPHTLLRTIVWYLDQFQNDEAKTLILQNGKPAVELSFTLPLGKIPSHDESFSYCGHFDRIAEYSNSLWVTDYKTTKGQLNTQYFAQFSPSIQMTGYTLASQIVFSAPAKGIIIDAVQLGVTFSRFARQQIHRSPSQVEEFLDDLLLDLEVATLYAKQESWPLNPASCHHYGGCEFRKVCSHSPAVRQNFLEADFVQRTWDPLKER